MGAAGLRRLAGGSACPTLDVTGLEVAAGWQVGDLPH
jgi:hypothetical protein